MNGTAAALILGVAMGLGASAPAAALGRSDNPVEPPAVAGQHSGDVEVPGFGTLTGVVRLERSAPAWDHDPCEGELVDQHQHGGDSKATTVEHDHHACGEFRSLVVDANNGLKFGVVSARYRRGRATLSCRSRRSRRSIKSDWSSCRTSWR